ncbi:SpoIVB peptidase S55 domain-containing protein [Phytoactinopolyspora mesophila]|uniref:SpoIVB peptidase S55 domain-containing protein n=1 Tax=Phytoactinopolyspora mesophila TaxID=2650750 RepID=UPI0013908104|nr:SpoIVB peptidase S55 domain-containing protein [Phytoactinopolyspora mesophila]
MSTTTRPIHARRRIATAGAAVGVTAIMTLLAAGTAPVTAGPEPAAAFDPCPAPYPVAELAEGMEATGLTVERGTEPEQFTATVVGVIDNGVGPDADMIIVETDSPAIERAGGVWSGMSGSPVYAADGRLIGAIAYGFSAAPSPIAGVTPATDLERLLGRQGTLPKAEPAHVEVPAELQQRLVASGGLTPAQASAGLRQLTLPLAASGISSHRLDDVSERLGEHSLNVHTYPAGSGSSDEPGSPADIIPGGNLAAAVSYGDVTMAAIGTATSVCDDDKALGFGHPFLWSGASSLGMHPASAVFVQRDDTFGSFKVANPHGVVGTITQDRQAGVLGHIGPAPSATPLTATVTTDEGASRSGTTNVTMPGFLPDMAIFHLWASFDTVLDRIGAGTADLRWVVEGTRADGEMFSLDVQNRYASQGDIAEEASYDVFEHLWTIQENEFENVTITGADFTGELSSEYTHYTMSSVEVRQPDGSFAPPSSDTPFEVDAGAELEMRVELSPFKNIGTARTIELSMDIPEDSAGAFGWVDVAGGHSQEDWDEEAPGGSSDDAASFDDLLRSLSTIVPNNAVAASLRIEEAADNPGTAVTQSVHEVVDEVVSGNFSFPVEVNQP